jgi:hypothetical protein
MKNYDLVLFNDIINIFEENKFAEANILHKQFIKLAQPIQNVNEKEALDIIAEKNLQDQFKQFAIEYYKSQSQFDESDDFNSIFQTYGSNNNILAEQFLLSLGNEDFIDVQDRAEKGKEIVEILDIIAESDIRLQKVNTTLKAAISRGLPIAFVLAGSAKLYYLLRYLINNREEVAKYATIIFGIVSSLLASIPTINFTLFNIQKVPTAYEMIEERRIINVTKINNIYKYVIDYKTADDGKNHEVSIVTLDNNDDREITKLRSGPGQLISENFESSKKYKTVRVYDNGELVDSQNENEANKQILAPQVQNTKLRSPESKTKFRKVEPEVPGIEKNKFPDFKPKSMLKPNKTIENLSTYPQKSRSKLGPISDKLDESEIFTISVPSTTVKPTSNLVAPSIDIKTDPLTVNPNSKTMIPDITENKEDTGYYLDKKPDFAKDQPEEFKSRKSRIQGIHISLDEMVENTLKRHLGENVSMKIHDFKTNEYNDVEQFVEFLFPNKKDNFIMEYKLNGNTDRKSMIRHPADYFKKKSRFSLPKINLDDEQVQGILYGLLKKK